MLDDIRALLILQDRDRRIATLVKDLEKIPQDEARAKQRYAIDAAAVQQAKQQLLDAELRLKRLELDAGTRKTTIQRLKTQQFETRKNEEYTALGNEVLRYQRELDELETQELELMEELDQLRGQLAVAEASVEKTRMLVRTELQTITQRKQRLTQDLAELRQERQKLAAPVSSGLLPIYEKLMKSKHGVAIAAVRDGKCGGCHIQLIATTIVDLMTDQRVVHCESCGRLLYHAD